MHIMGVFHYTGCFCESAYVMLTEPKRAEEMDIVVFTVFNYKSWIIYYNMQNMKYEIRRV